MITKIPIKCGRCPCPDSNRSPTELNSKTLSAEQPLYWDCVWGLIVIIWFGPVWRAFGKLRKAAISFVLPVRPSEWNSLPSTGRFLMEFNIWVFLENLLVALNFDVQGWAMKREDFKAWQKSIHESFIYLLVINGKHMNSHFVLCRFENLCFENNALKMAFVSTHAFLKSGRETLHDLSQHLHRNCSHFILNSLF